LFVFANSFVLQAIRGKRHNKVKMRAKGGQTTGLRSKLIREKALGTPTSRWEERGGCK